MSISRHIRQYWPLAIVTVSIVWGLPFLTGYGESRPGLAGITGHAGGLTSDDGEDLMATALSKPQAGYARPAGMLPFYGFDGISLDEPIFNSWWEGKAAPAGAKLRELRANTITLGPIWKDAFKFHDIVARMHGNGVKVIVQVTEAQDWVDLVEDEHGKLQPVPSTFVSGRASHVLAQARNNGVGRFADFILLGGDAQTFATQLQRQKMYQLAKQYFPSTPIVRRYSIELDKSESLQGKAHPMGGNWDEYRFGPDECDIALVAVGRGVDEGRVGVRVKSVLEQLNHIVSIVKSRHGDAAVIVTARFGDEQLLGNTKSAMWTPKEIDQFVTAILTSAGVDGLLFNGLGRSVYDLGYPDFTAQRDAVREAAPGEAGSLVAARLPGVPAGTPSRSPAGERPQAPRPSALTSWYELSRVLGFEGIGIDLGPGSQ